MSKIYSRPNCCSQEQVEFNIFCISGGICFTILFSLISFILFALPISEIYFGINYGDSVNCTSRTINLTLKNWLVIKGSLAIVNILTFSPMFLFNNKSLVYYICYIINSFFLIFNLSWLIVGSIIFWVDCKNLEPANINTLMYFSLIFGYISYLNQIAFFNKNIENKKNEKPLLDV